MNFRGLRRAMTTFGAVGVGVAVLLQGLAGVVGRLEGPVNPTWARRLLDVVFPLLWPVPDYFAPAGMGLSYWNLLLGLLWLMLLNFIPYAALGACWYLARPGLRRLRGSGTAAGHGPPVG